MQFAPPLLRSATRHDAEAVRRIYNEGIADRMATLDTDPKSVEDMAAWWADHDAPHAVVVAEDEAGNVVGWASLNRYSHRCADRRVADLSVYVARERRGTGVGFALLSCLERIAKANGFHKIVLSALTSNDRGHGLYRKAGYADVGIFREHGQLDGKYVDILAMEKILRPLVLFVCKHNTGRSQMAEAFLRQFAGSAVDVASAGTIAADRPDPGVVAAMAEVSIDISNARPKVLDAATVARADRIITMGCDVEGVPRIDDDWGLPDPKGQTPERVREIRDLVALKAQLLAESIPR
jgi:phosphinothricin acetyltransferase